MSTPPPNPPFSSSSSTTSHQSLPATSPSPSPSPMSDDEDNPAAVNFNGDTNTNNTTSSPPTQPKPSPSPSRSESQSPSRSQSRSVSASASPFRSPSVPVAQPLPPPPPSRTPPVFPAREDCWTEAATHTLIEAWGSHYVELNRGNLRQKHWQEVADAVNALHAHIKKQHRTDIQCKNRIDTLKKKYKIEKSQTVQSNGRYVSTWPFFNGLDALIGDAFLKNALSISSPSPVTTPARATKQFRKISPVPIQAWRSPPALPPPPSAVPVAPRSKRPVSEEVLSRRNFSAMAAAAARAKEEEDDEDDDECEGSETSGAAGGVNVMADGFKKLAEAVGRFAEIYERVEMAKQRQMVELEKQRMQFARDLEIQRMNIYAESQVHLGRLKRTKRNSHNGEGSDYTSIQ